MNWRIGATLFFIIGDRDNRLSTIHSYHVSISNKIPQSNTYTKSDLSFSRATSSTISGINETCSAGEKCNGVYKFTSGDYYKKYEHDKVPLKDSDNPNLSNISNKYLRAIVKSSFTSDDLNNLEKRIFSNISQELQTDGHSLTSLDSNIKIFKMTVEKIFETFYTSMRDFEHYKKRFHEILDKNDESSNDDMEEFIKAMCGHIMSSDKSASNISCNSEKIDVDDKCVEVGGDSSLKSENGLRIVEAYKNDHYLTDSTLHEDSSKTNPAKIEDKFDVCLLGGNPCVQIKLYGRDLLSDINIKEPTKTVTTGSTKSADNMKILAAKNLELEKYIRQQHDGNMPDRDIPVKISCAKKNIYLNEDFAVRNCEHTNASQSFLSKICKILCRKFRKTSGASYKNFL